MINILIVEDEIPAQLTLKKLIDRYYQNSKIVMTLTSVKSTIQWLEENPEGVACVVGAPWVEERARVHSLAPEHVKGLEFDLVLLVDPGSWGAGIEGAVDRYVAMTRATSELMILHGS